MSEIKNQISIEKIKQWFGKIMKGKPSYGKEGMKPEKDWDRMIVAVVILFCVEALLALFIYFEIKNNAWFNQPEDSTVSHTSLNQNLLQKITGQIDAKSAAYSSSPSVGVSDPSL